MQPVACTVEIIAVRAVRSVKKAPVSEPGGVNGSRLGRIGVFATVRYIAAGEDAILVAHPEAPRPSADRAPPDTADAPCMPAATSTSAACIASLALQTFSSWRLRFFAYLSTRAVAMRKMQLSMSKSRRPVRRGRQMSGRKSLA
jgi:hypothetical protein